ncbi:peptide-methionine (S)-S-oxide reductase [Bacillus sp. FJAT-45350]|uniref:peptide-methionine (S)-S-oxide reductase n=1 Tax=Bacillus sp. FJAT-45350 TaxID=2011014 RepID=UPI000BB9B32C|nr:peptide-methionine (S)-S-oxide reductase [Bacillus sp. FJAT-45350]
MERAVFGASEFFSQKAFFTGYRGIEYVQIEQVKGTNLDIVEIWFNPWKVSYTELVDLFFDLHDPTTRDGQQRNNQSFIFFSNSNQLKVAKQKKKALNHSAKCEVITEITPVGVKVKEIKQIS